LKFNVPTEYHLETSSDSFTWSVISPTEPTSSNGMGLLHSVSWSRMRGLLH
jgi:hypothetical protein